MKFIFLVEYPVGQRDYQRFGIDLLRGEGLDVEVWDFAPFIHPQVYAAKPVPDPIEFAGATTFFTEGDALRAIADVPRPAVFMVLLAFSRRHRRIWRALSASGVPFGVEQAIAQPPPVVPPRRNFARRLKRMLTRPSTVLNQLFVRVPPRLFGIRSPHFVLAGGYRSISRAYPVDHKTRIVRCHTLDYDIHLRERERPLAERGAYAVFLDEFWPFHPDFLQEMLPHPISADAYYPRLRRVFEKVERELGWDVVIAAHPRSRYDSMPDFFGGRRVVKGETASLVRGARLVIGHDSVSLNFAVLYRKPTLFLSIPLDPLLEGLVMVDTLARAFGKVPVPLLGSLDIDWAHELQVDEAAYDAYRDNYIKVPSSPEKPTWKIVSEFLQEGAGAESLSS